MTTTAPEVRRDRRTTAARARRPTTRCFGTKTSATGASTPAPGPGCDTVIRDQNISRRCLRVLDEHVEVAVVVEDSRVEQLVFHVIAPALLVCLHELAVGVRALRVLVQVLHVRMRWRRVEIEVVLLHVLAVVAFAVRETEQAFLDDRIFAVPERERDTRAACRRRCRRGRPRPNGRYASEPDRG